MNRYLNFDGKIIGAGMPLITAGNRGFCYGDGLFETMKVQDSVIELATWHFERLFEGMRLMSFDVPDFLTPPYLEDQVYKLCERNNCTRAARVRLMIFRGNGGIYDSKDNSPHFIIQTFDLPPVKEDGLLLGLYTDARKAIDKFSHLKTNNYQPYTLAAIHARKNGWDDCLILNSDGNICESTIANVFVIKDGTIITPSLEQGCVAGVMKKNLLLKLPTLNYKVKETVVTVEMIKAADEVFLTNAVRGIRWVNRFEDVHYSNKEISCIYNAIKAGLNK